MPLFSWTGNPWVDAGLSAILAWSRKQHPSEITIDDVLNIREFLQSLYLTSEWKSSNFTIFVNYPTNNPSNKGKEEHKLKEFFSEMIKNMVTLGAVGSCIACGGRDVVSRKTRQHVPMTGSGGMRNYFSHASDGADYCDACTFAVQCAPLVFYACGGRMILLHSNSEKIMRYWARRCIENVNRQAALKKYDGCFNEGYKKPINALFHITQDLILTYDEAWQNENASIRLCYFTNYIAKPAELDIYDLPSPVFHFLSYIRPHPKYRDWLKVIYKGYRNIEDKTEEEYRNYNNSVYQALLDGRSIIGYFLDIRTKMAIGDWSLLKYYLKEVLSMDDKRIETIRKIGDDIAEIIKTSSNGKKRLGQIERATNYASFRNVLLRLTRDKVVLKADTPLLTFDEYAKYLFPEGAMGWKETQDLLLFRLYENLHPWLIAEGLIVEEDEESEEVTAS